MAATPRRSANPARARRACALVVLAFAVLLAQSIGLAHHALHAGASVGNSVSTASAPAASATWGLGLLLGGHRPGADCQLFDPPVAHAPPAIIRIAPPPDWVPARAERGQAVVLQAQAAPFDARGPPARA